MTNLSNDALNVFNVPAVQQHTSDEVEAQMRMLKLSGARKAYHEDSGSQRLAKMPLDDALHYLLDCEIVQRKNNAYFRNLNKADREITVSANFLIENSEQYNLNTSQAAYLLDCKWFGEQTLVVTGASGTGKSMLCSAIIDAACIKGLKAKNLRYPMLAMELSEKMKRNGEEFKKYLKNLCSFNLLVIDDFCFCERRRENEAEAVKELLDAAASKKCGLIIASQMSQKGWHAYFGDGIMANAIVERIIVANKHFTIKLEGDSKRAGDALKIPSKNMADTTNGNGKEAQNG